MATHRNDYANEKVDEEKPVFTENAHESPTITSLNLEKERTLEGIDTQNLHAYMGDDSDGKVTWGLRSIFAAIFLAGLYTGMFTLLQTVIQFDLPVLQALRSFYTSLVAL